MNIDWKNISESNSNKFKVENGYVHFEQKPGFIMETGAVLILEDLATMLCTGQQFEQHNCIKDTITQEDIDNSPGVIVEAEHSPNTIYLINTEYDDAMEILIMTIYTYVAGTKTAVAEFDWFEDLKPICAELNK